MFEEEAKAVQEASKAVVKVTDAAQQSGSFIAKFISGSLEQGVGIFEDKLKYIRFERQMRLMKKTQSLLVEYGLHAPDKAIPLKIAIPIFQAATMEEDDFLQDQWANLLINASSSQFEQEVKRVHISILENLSSLDAHVLNLIYSIPLDEGSATRIATTSLPERVFIANDNNRYEKKLPKEIILSLSNLTRLGCIEPLSTYGGGAYFYEVLPTELGRDFVRACQLQQKN